ncbi:MAG TPA: hypothetical protein VL475_04400, partial [Planctomycetaceae bacterium]|nr:hypothetical protein [Planctomycetaceae bacterium]
MRHPRRLLPRQLWKKVISLALAASMTPLPGCSTVDRKLTYLGDSELKYYDGQDLDINEPAVDEPTPETVAITQKPRRLGD